MRRRDPLLFVILCWTALVAGVLVWLPLVRGATQGDAYQWQLASGIGGRGMGGDYWMLIAGAGFALWMLYLGWRGGRNPFPWLLLAFHLPLAAFVTAAAWADPHGFRLEGATAGIDIPLAAIGPLLFGGVAVAAIVWVLRYLRPGAPRLDVPFVWSRATTIRLLLVILIVPIEMLLFRSGGIQSMQNMIGIFFVGWQWVMVNRILAGGRPAGSTP